MVSEREVFAKLTGEVVTAALRDPRTMIPTGVEEARGMHVTLTRSPSARTLTGVQLRVDVVVLNGMYVPEDGAQGRSEDGAK
jgi:hypothetical protein